ncbi:A disintegrin and metalloproteinase with thrombospondin motifs 6-like [Diadema antillarum]|uniref:A disintegrin and metalloproteinase with thrombospondin motifs 6-like n=1 Tax=Diadema antillarum TaxID=105358 RepID=UPI003A8AF9A6
MSDEELVDWFGVRAPSDDVFSPSLLIHHQHTRGRSSLRAQRSNCHYRGDIIGDNQSAIEISVCKGHLNGLVSTTDSDFFIREVPERFGVKSEIVRRSAPDVLGGNHKYIELMVVADSTMVGYHGNELENYLKTVMSIAAGAFRSASISASISLHVVRCVVLETDQMDPVIEPDARTSLRNFCKWQRGVYPEGVGESGHFDVAALITRHDLTRNDVIAGNTVKGVLGLAHMSSACVASRRCLIVEDSGLATGLTLAHEIGHTLGMEHDGARNPCPTSGHVMASLAPSGPGAYTWSSCSVEYLHTFLRSPISHCLNNRPSMTKNLTLYRGWRPGQIFHRDEQCKFLYADSTGACSQKMDDCEKLWCGRTNEGVLVCSTNKYPPADGTECGEGKWCIGGECVDYGERGPDPIHGGWSEWEPNFSECSRTCGGGIRKKYRHCNSPRPSFGGANCIGLDTIIEACNIFDCEDGNQLGYAQEQCATRDALPYKEELLPWEPYTDRKLISADEFCQQSCVSYSRGIVVKFGAFVDGTRCDVVDVFNRGVAMCVAEKCRNFACDFDSNSSRVYDACGVCGGNQTTCDLDSDLNRINIGNGFEPVLEIPNGSTFVNVTNFNNDCHLAVIAGEQLVFGDSGQEVRSKAYTTGTDVISYITGDHENIHIRGPTTTNLTIQIYKTNTSSASAVECAIQWSLYKPNQEPRQTYEWAVEKSDCSKTCGFGILRSEVTCREVGNDAHIVGDFNCQHLQRPPVKEETCNTFNCPFRWEVGDWEDCNVACGRGVRWRKVFCARSNGEGVAEVGSEEMCDGADSKPVHQEQCHLPPCTDDATCNLTISASTGHFSSPNHPGAYPPNIDCGWTISVNHGYWIKLTFMTFDLEGSSPAHGKCVFDFVEVLGSKDSGAMSQVTRLCGRRDTPFSVVVESDTALVRLQSDHLIQRTGFLVTFDELDP